MLRIQLHPGGLQLPEYIIEGTQNLIQSIKRLKKRKKVEKFYLKTMNRLSAKRILTSLVAVIKFQGIERLVQYLTIGVNSFGLKQKCKSKGKESQAFPYICSTWVVVQMMVLIPYKYLTSLLTNYSLGQLILNLPYTCIF